MNFGDILAELRKDNNMLQKDFYMFGSKRKYGIKL